MPILGSTQGRLVNKTHRNSTRLDGLVHVCIFYICGRVCERVEICLIV
jgi:hypothetical protein